MLIVCNGMIRSGSTLQYNLISELMNANGKVVRAGFFAKVDYLREREKVNAWVNAEMVYIIKTHDLFEENIDVHNGKVKFLYIYRDIRDVAVSVKRIFGLYDAELINELDKAIIVYDFFEKYRSCINVHFQKYEDFIADINGSSLEVAKFLEVSLNDEQIHDACEKVSLNQMRKKSVPSKLASLKITLWKACVVLKLGRIVLLLGVSPSFVSKVRFYLYPHNKNNMLHDKHISVSGGASVWKESLSKSEVTFLIDRYREYLSSNDYL